MSQTWAKVDHYLCNRLIPADPILDGTLVANASAGLPAIDVAPNQGKFLYLLALMQRASRILELGTLGGYSTIWLARALPLEGRLISLEAEPKHVEVARANIERAGLSSQVEIRLGPASESLAKLHQEKVEPFDLIFIDADKPNYPTYLDGALKLSQSGTVIIGDNVIRDGAVIDDQETDPRVIGVRQFIDLISNDSRLSATAMQTVGVKGYDGFVLAIVK